MAPARRSPAAPKQTARKSTAKKSPANGSTAKGSSGSRAAVNKATARRATGGRSTTPKATRTSKKPSSLPTPSETPDAVMTDAPSEGPNTKDQEYEETAGTAPAWADDRGSLSAAIRWFNSHQGGVYYTEGMALGILVDGDSGSRHFVDDEIVISRTGGGNTKDKDGELQQTEDQDENARGVKALFNSWRNGIPVGIVFGNRYPGLKNRLPRRFNVAGFYRITDIWPEKSNNHNCWKVRFQKLHLDELSWWAKKGSPQPVPHDKRLTEPVSKVCNVCRKPHKQIYKQRWTCLDSECVEFWKINGREPDEELTFHDKFLEYRVPQDDTIKPHYPLVPDILSTFEDSIDPSTSTMRIIAKAGLVCPLCGKCIARRFWEGWKCSDNLKGETHRDCPYEKWLPLPPLSLRAVIDDVVLGPIKRAMLFNKHDPNAVTLDVDDRSSSFRQIGYNIEGIGSVMHFVSTAEINARSGGPNDMFAELQQEKSLGLRRYPMGTAVVAGQLNAQFAVNYGLPYKFIVSVDSKPFSKACPPILRALGRLTWAGKAAVQNHGGHVLDPNELLLLGYMEDQEISYHDDGESSLGPTIASLSLGSKATMTIRMKYKYYAGYTKTSKKTLIPDDPVLPGCHNYEARRELKNLLVAGKLDRTEYEERWWQAHRQVQKPRQSSPACFSMELWHGDMVVMDGAKVQKYYEHQVKLVDGGKLRFALTARHVKHEMVEKDDLWKGEFELAGDQIYDGR